MFAGTRPASSRDNNAAEPIYEAALTAKAGPTPAQAMITPARGASTIWAATATVHSAVLASTIWSCATTSGTNDDAAGLNISEPTDSPNATPKTTATDECSTTRTLTSTARVRSA